MRLLDTSPSGRAAKSGRMGFMEPLKIALALQNNLKIHVSRPSKWQIQAGNIEGTFLRLIGMVDCRVLLAWELESPTPLSTHAEQCGNICKELRYAAFLHGSEN